MVGVGTGGSGCQLGCVVMLVGCVWCGGGCCWMVVMAGGGGGCGVGGCKIVVVGLVGDVGWWCVVGLVGGVWSGGGCCRMVVVFFGGEVGG